MEDPLRSATAVIVAASYPTSTKSSAAASRKPASRRVERSCCGATRTAFDEIEGTLILYIQISRGHPRFIETVFHRRNHGRTTARPPENRTRHYRPAKCHRRHEPRAAFCRTGRRKLQKTCRGLPRSRRSRRLRPRRSQRLR